MMTNLMTILERKAFISSNPRIVLSSCPPPCGHFSIQESATGGLSYKVKKIPGGCSPRESQVSISSYLLIQIFKICCVKLGNYLILVSSVCHVTLEDISGDNIKSVYILLIYPRNYVSAVCIFQIIVCRCRIIINCEILGSRCRTWFLSYNCNISIRKGSIA